MSTAYAHPLPDATFRDALAQAVGRLTPDDTIDIAAEAFERGTRGEDHSPAGLLSLCLRNPAGAGWRLTPADLRPVERGAMRGLVVRAHAAGKAAR